MDHVDEDKCRISVNNMAVRKIEDNLNITRKRKASTTPCYRTVLNKIIVEYRTIFPNSASQYCRTVRIMEKCWVPNIVYNVNEVKSGEIITLETDGYLNSRKK